MGTIGWTSLEEWVHAAHVVFELRVHGHESAGTSGTKQPSTTIRFQESASSRLRSRHPGNPILHAAARLPSPTLSPTDPVPRGLLTLCPAASSGP